LIYIPWHFPLQSDKSIQGASKKAEQEFQMQYPAVYNHLLQYKKELSLRNKAETGIRYEWYAMQRWGANYSEDFNKPKIVFQEIVQESQFMLDENIHFLCNDTCRIITGNHLKYLMAIMNSSLFFFAVKRFYGGGGLGENGVRMKHTFFINFPCIKPTEYQESKILKYIDMKNFNSINNEIFNLYNLTNEEKEFIETQ